jgi:hypothetical protein
LIQLIKQKLNYIFRVRQFNGAKKLHDVLQNTNYSLDETTCFDIGIEDVNLELNHNKTTFGSELFEHWLKSIKKHDELIELQEDIRITLKSDK